MLLWVAGPGLLHQPLLMDRQDGGWWLAQPLWNPRVINTQAILEKTNDHPKDESPGAKGWWW